MIAQTNTNTHTPQIVAYYRVSTKKQSLGIDAQRNDVTQYAQRNGLAVIAEFSEKESGKNDDRQQLRQAIQYAQQQKAVLVVSKLDRLSRNAAYLINLFNEMKLGGLNMIALNMPPVDDILIYGTYALLAQKERELISERTKNAMSIKKSNGEKLGNPNVTADAYAKGLEVRKANARKENETAYKMALLIRKECYRPSHIAKRLNELGIKTRNGKEWTCQQIKNLFALYGDSVTIGEK